MGTFAAYLAAETAVFACWPAISQVTLHRSPLAVTYNRYTTCNCLLQRCGLTLFDSLSNGNCRKIVVCVSDCAIEFRPFLQSH